MPIKLSFNSYTIGWLCALPKSELVAAEAMLDEAHEPPGNLGSHDDNCYTYGSINQHNVVIVHMPGGMPGTLSAQRMAQPLSKTFPNLKIHLLVGIAGGVPRDPPLEDPNKDIHLGDVVVGWADVTGDPAIVQWDFMREENDGECRLLGRLANPHVRLLNALGVLQKKSVQGKTRFSDHLERVEVEGFSYPGLEYDRLYRADYPHPNQDSFDCSSCDPNEMVKREPRTARTLIWHQGTIASGNQVVRNPMTRDKVSKRCYNALAFEMEAAGVMNEKHCLVIRGIADYCDTHKNWLWQNWAATTAAAFARELLYTIQPQAVDEIEPLATTARAQTTNDPRSLQATLKTWLAPSDEEKVLISLEMERYPFPEACNWFLEKHVYQKWKSQTVHGSLYVEGGSGTGKTFLVSKILVDIKESHPEAYRLYFFCRFSDGTALTSLNTIIRTFLYQLSSQSQLAEQYLWKIFESKEYSNLDDVDAVDLLKRVFERSLGALPATASVYVLLDGLDEMRSSRDEQEKLLGFLIALSKPLRKGSSTRPYKASCLFTTRCSNHRYHQNLLSPLEHCKIDAHDTVSDLKALIDWSLCTPSQAIKSMIIEKTNGVFIWAKFIVDEVRNADTMEDKLKLIESLPHGLFEYYQQAVSRIENKLTTHQIIIGRHILGWVLMSMRPLTLDELQEALREYGTFDDLASTIQKTCGSCLELFEGQVRPAHASVHRFFIPHEGLSRSQWSQHDISAMYLEMFTICCEALQTPDNHGALEEYAAWNMMKHLELAASIPVTSNSTAALLEKITAKKCAAMIMSITALANRELAHSQLADSEKLLKEALAFATKRFGEASMEVLVALGRLGNAYVRQERYGDALSLFTEQMNMHEELRRQGHELGIPGLVEAAEVQELGHQLVEGEKLRLRAIEYGQSHGPDLILIAQQQLALALNMEEQEKFDDAYHFFEQCVSSVGRENTDLWFSIREEFALFQERRGQKGVVLAEFEKMYEEQVSISGRQDVKSMIRKWYVACFTMDHEDNWPRSDRLWEEIIAWKTDKEGRNTTSMAALVKSWAWNCKKHERWEKARSIANDALEIARRAYKPGAYAISGHLLILGDIAFGQGRREEGTEYYEEGIKIHADILGNQHPWTLDARESLRMQQAPEGREISRPRRDSIHPYTPRHVRTRREWRSLKNSAERELYCRV